MHLRKTGVVDNKQNTMSNVGAKLGAVAGFGGYIASSAIKEGGLKNLFTTTVIPHPEIPDQFVRANLANLKGKAIKTGMVGLCALGAAAILAVAGSIVGKVIDVIKNKKNPQLVDENKKMLEKKASLSSRGCVA